MIIMAVRLAVTFRMIVMLIILIGLAMVIVIRFFFGMIIVIIVISGRGGGFASDPICIRGCIAASRPKSRPEPSWSLAKYVSVS